MILIWGSRVMMKKVGEGTFYSPAAGRDATYHLKQARRWFTLFFIPIFPMKTIGTFVECQETRKRYDPSILERATNDAIRTQLTGAARELFAAVAVADGPPSNKIRETAVATVQSYDPTYGPADFETDCAAAPSSVLNDRLVFLAENLNPTGAEKFLQSAFTVAASDGALSPNRQAVLASAGQTLTLSPAHVSGILAGAPVATQDAPPQFPPPQQS